MPRTTEQPKSEPTDRDELAAENVRRLVEGVEQDAAAAELAKTNGHAPGADLDLVGEAGRLVVEAAGTLARLVDQDRFDQLAAADRRCIGDLNALTVKAVAQRDGDGTRQLVSVDVVGQVLAAARQWAAARGLGGNGGGGSA